MRLQHTIVDLIVLILVIPAVIFFFHFIPDRRLAATAAGILFVGVPLALMAFRWGSPLRACGAGILWWAGVLQFWLLFAIPILGTRLIWWDADFASFTFFGVFSGEVWHRWANASYIVMLAGIAGAAIQSFLESRPAR